MPQHRVSMDPLHSSHGNGGTCWPSPASWCTCGALYGGHLLKCTGAKKLRKKKGEEESDKEPYSKFTREPRKKKESPTPRSCVAKGPKKQQGGGAAPTSLQAPVRGTSCPHAPCPASAISGPVSAGALHVSGELFGQNPSTHRGGKGQRTCVHGAGCRVGIVRGHAPWECCGRWLAGATSTLDVSLEQKDGVGKK